MDYFGTAFLVIILVYMLWHKKSLNIIFVCSELCLKKYKHSSSWITKETARYKKVLKNGTLWWGYNRNTGSGFVMFDGDGKNSMRLWKLQNQCPRFILKRKKL
ncbi:MAG: hypothetical protein U9Q12_03575 [Patescibacteria group bacterium]|nr:hypothetical protein [Patescibacteria group bacterium]